jgi:hypothetical protein
MRILVGNEPFSYRHVQAETFRVLRPDAEIVLVEPLGVDQAVATFAPHVVLCSTLSEVIRNRALAWVLLYPDGADMGVVSIAGKEQTIHQIDFDDLLAVIDETNRYLGEQPAPL